MKRKRQNGMRTLMLTMGAVMLLTPVGTNAADQESGQKTTGAENHCTISADTFSAENTQGDASAAPVEQKSDHEKEQKDQEKERLPGKTDSETEESTGIDLQKDIGAGENKYQEEEKQKDGERSEDDKTMDPETDTKEVSEKPEAGKKSDGDKTLNPETDGKEESEKSEGAKKEDENAEKNDEPDNAEPTAEQSAADKAISEEPEKSTGDEKTEEAGAAAEAGKGKEQQPVVQDHDNKEKKPDKQIEEEGAGKKRSEKSEKVTAESDGGKEDIPEKQKEQEIKQTKETDTAQKEPEKQRQTASAVTGGERPVGTPEEESPAQPAPEIRINPPKEKPVLSQEEITAGHPTPVKVVKTEPDTKKPEIRISGAQDLSANRRPLRISVDFRDDNLKENSIYAYLMARNSGKRIEGVRKSGTSSGSIFEFPEINEDDYYVLTAGCSDMAGNQTVRKISFTENRKGTVTALKNVSLKDSTVRQKEVSPVFHISGVDEVMEAVADVNGKRVPVKFNKEGNLVLTNPLTKEGSYSVRIKTKDASGNEVSSDPVNFSIDRTKPRISVKKEEKAVKDQKTQKEGTDIVISKDRKEDEFTEILVDGRKVEEDEYTTLKNGNIRLKVPGKGDHTVRVTAEDEAGNREVSDLTFSSAASEKKKRSGFKSLIVILSATIAGAAGALFYYYRRKTIRKK